MPGDLVAIVGAAPKFSIDEWSCDASKYASVVPDCEKRSITPRGWVHSDVELKEGHGTEILAKIYVQMSWRVLRKKKFERRGSRKLIIIVE